MLTKLKQVLVSATFWSVITISFFSFLARGLGFVRQSLTYIKLESFQSDLLVSGNKVPDFLAMFLIMGTIFSSVLPVASRQKNDKDISQYLNLVIFATSLIIGFLSLLIVIFTRPILEIFTSSSLWEEAIKQDYLEEYILATRIMCLIPIVSALQSILGVFLNLKKKFLVYSLAGVIANLGSILGLYLSDNIFLNKLLGNENNTQSIVIVSISMVCGWMISNLVFLIQALISGFSFPDFKYIFNNWELFKTDLIQTWSLFLPRIFLIDGYYGASLMMNPIAANTGQITAFDIGNSISAAFYILIIALTTVTFPDLSKTLNNVENSQDFWPKFRKYVFITFVLSLFVTFLALILSPLIMYLFRLIGKGQGNEDYVSYIAQISAFSLIFRSIRDIFSQYFFVLERKWQPVILSTIGLVVEFLIINILYRLNFDTGYGASIALIFYNLVWVIVAFWMIKQDRNKINKRLDK
jgi:peptidoglycan biosynthesis protein MviN/MurJ (putative lipid II flippase)